MLIFFSICNQLQFFEPHRELVLTPQESAVHKSEVALLAKSEGS
jgi:hypothetical protein